MSHTSSDGSSMMRRLLRPAHWFALVSLLLITALLTIFFNSTRTKQHTDEHAHEVGGPTLSEAHGLVADSTCATPGDMLTVTLSDTGFDAKTVHADLCDVLRIDNRSTAAAELAIGPHEHHVHYPGYNEQRTLAGQSATISLGTHGSFQVHDHFNDNHSFEVEVATARNP